MGESFLSESRVRGTDYPSAELLTQGHDPGPITVMENRESITDSLNEIYWRDLDV